MLLVVGALAALAFTALPGIASAQETALKCQIAPCAFTFVGGVSTFSTIGGDTISCASVTGSGEAINLVSNETTTTRTSLIFHGCKETTTIFKFNCTTPGQLTGTTTTNTITGHLIALPGVGAENGVLLTEVKGTFTCAGGFARSTITGNLIVENEAKCGTAASNVQKLNFEATGHGAQKITTWTGKTFNLLYATSHNETPTTTSGYEALAVSGTANLTWNQNVQVTCTA
jgi:hypothetical protein